MGNENREVLLSVRDMTVDFGSHRNPFRAVDHVSFDIYKGETFGLVGESASTPSPGGRSFTGGKESAEKSAGSRTGR